jgi:hypothetical protein
MTKMCPVNINSETNQTAGSISSVDNYEYLYDFPNVGTLSAEDLLPCIFSFLADTTRDIHSIQCTCKNFYENLNCHYLIKQFQLFGEPDNRRVRNVLSHVEYPPAAIACLQKYAECGNLEAINL